MNTHMQTDIAIASMVLENSQIAKGSLAPNNLSVSTPHRKIPSSSHTQSSESQDRSTLKGFRLFGETKMAPGSSNVSADPRRQCAAALKTGDGRRLLMFRAETLLKRYVFDCNTWPFISVQFSNASIICCAYAFNRSLLL